MQHVANTQVYILTKPNCSSSKKIPKYMKANNIPHKLFPVNKSKGKAFLTREVVLQIMRSSIGTEDFIIKTYLPKAENMTTEQLINNILTNPSILKMPICIQHLPRRTRITIGYNEDTLRTFLPPEEKAKIRLRLQREIQKHSFSNFPTENTKTA